MNWLIGIPGAAFLCDMAWAYIKPYKACPLCNGRGHCVRCNYTGKVLRFGARWVHPELRRR
jgi:hypothetical protein